MFLSVFRSKNIHVSFNCFEDGQQFVKNNNKWVFPKIVFFYPKSSHFNRVFHYKPFILGYPYFWKHPNGIPKFKHGINFDSQMDIDINIPKYGNIHPGKLTAGSQKKGGLDGTLLECFSIFRDF